MRSLGGVPGIRVRAISRLYATRPVGVTDQPDFHNAVVSVDVAVDAPAGPDPAQGALTLLVQLKALERSFGREVRERWGPRELDLDLLIFGKARIRVERSPDARSIDASTDPSEPATYLEVPHRDARERLFVLAPLADIARWLVPPGWHETVETARARRIIVEGQDAVLPVATWDQQGERWQPAGGGASS